MFVRISSSRRTKISAFAGGDDATTILSSCSPHLMGYFSDSAATPLRKVCKEFGATFKVPTLKPAPYTMSVETLDKSGNYFARHYNNPHFYAEFFQWCPEKFLAAFHYLFYMRKIPNHKVLSPLTKTPVLSNNFFMNDSTFQAILKDIFTSLSASGFFSKLSTFEPQSVHLLVLKMAHPLCGLNWHSRELCSEFWNNEKLKKKFNI